jgi:dTDP-L-rhamnose 4-epimerase
VLLEAMIERAKKRPFERLVVASSMSIYGEGMYRTADGGLVHNAERKARQLKGAVWDPVDEAGGHRSARGAADEWVPAFAGTPSPLRDD